MLSSPRVWMFASVSEQSSKCRQRACPPAALHRLPVPLLLKVDSNVSD